MAWELELLWEMEDEVEEAQEQLEAAHRAWKRGQLGASGGRRLGRLAIEVRQAINRARDAQALQRVADTCQPVGERGIVRFRRTGEHVMRFGKNAIHAIEVDGRSVGFIARFWGEVEVWFWGDQTGSEVPDLAAAKAVARGRLELARA